jgi:hypothetical protein
MSMGDAPLGDIEPSLTTSIQKSKGGNTLIKTAASTQKVLIVFQKLGVNLRQNLGI